MSKKDLEDRAMLAWYKREVKVAKVVAANLPTYDCPPPFSAIAKWRATLKRQMDNRVRRAMTKLREFRERTGIFPPKPFKPLPAKACDRRIQRQYHDVKATLVMFQEVQVNGERFLAVVWRAD